MTKEQALHFFEIDSDFQSIELLDIIDEMLFNLKNEVLQKMHVPQLLIKRKQQCEKIIEAQTALQMIENPIIPTFKNLNTHFNPIDFLEEYEHLLSALKLSIFNAKYPQTLLAGIDACIELQQNYGRQFPVLFSEFKRVETEIASQSVLETGILLRNLKSNSNIEETKNLIEKELARLYKLDNLGA